MKSTPSLGPAHSQPPSSWLDSRPLGPEPSPAGGRLPDAAAASTLRQLQRQQGQRSLQALVLALVQTPGSAREAQAWAEETRSAEAAASAVLALLREVPTDAHLPLLEWALQTLTTEPAPDRAELLRSARRVMAADGKVRPVDRLRWLLMRHLLAGGGRRAPLAPMPGARAEHALADLPDTRRRAIARFTAYLARMVPLADPIAKVGSAGVNWHRSVLRHCWPDGDVPPCEVPDADALAHALADLQQLTWVQRPVLVRLWVQAALKVTRQLWPGEPLTREAAEALRIATVLLDTPVPGAVASRFIALPGDGPPH